VACCAFAALIVGQFFALLGGWSLRLRRLFGLPAANQPPSLSMYAQQPASPGPLRWRKGLVVALVLELGLLSGFATVAAARQTLGLLPPSLLAWCSQK
jgi:hypothetical protein